MKLLGLRVENLLTFDNFTLDFNFDNTNAKSNYWRHMHFIIGPNNSGKTNLLRILKLLKYKLERKRVWIYDYFHNKNKFSFRIEAKFLLDEDEKDFFKFLIKLYVKYNYEREIPNITQMNIPSGIRDNIVKSVKEFFMEELPKLADKMSYFIIKWFSDNIYQHEHIYICFPELNICMDEHIFFSENQEKPPKSSRYLFDVYFGMLMSQANNIEIPKILEKIVEGKINPLEAVQSKDIYHWLIPL